ncbi:MAG: hypothetical protein H0V70_03210 [Ktedonobacteraceae bacterium]|nr:hypothetical protein [Ktedonobacteraceae bacterium]
MQSLQTRNLASEISPTLPTVNRLNTIYMVSYFIGGSLGTALATYGWSVARWNGVCAVGIFMLVIAIGRYFLKQRQGR